MDVRLKTRPAHASGIAYSLLIVHHVFLGEHVEVYHVVGFALILAGVSLAARPASKAAAVGAEVAPDSSLR